MFVINGWFFISLAVILVAGFLSSIFSNRSFNSGEMFLSLGKTILYYYNTYSAFDISSNSSNKFEMFFGINGNLWNVITYIVTPNAHMSTGLPEKKSVFPWQHSGG